LPDSYHIVSTTMSPIPILNSIPVTQVTEKSIGEEVAVKELVENGSPHVHSSGDDILKTNGTSGACPFRPPPLTGTKIYGEAQKEVERIRTAHRTLAPTGCTPDFCQSGRMTRINEPRVGRDRPLAEIQQEAVDFLRECRDHGVIESDEVLTKRTREALIQISNTAIVSTVTDSDGNVSEGMAGGSWHQLPAELEYGLRAAWRNARRCIMRSEHEHLALCDLRRVQSSREMARTIVKGMQTAFNRGHILPTVFVFPPRQPGKRGPMIWNHQMLAFAGYKQADGSILGDPANVHLTESMIEYGWKPPINKSRWDMLPLITMAENDAPYMMELPLELRRTVQITHPRYEQEFSDLDLRWVVAPALCRLGFDIGGNQYTATPFIGWFMDSEIGVRDLADTFRYNVLPDVVNALRLSPEPETPLDDLPEYMHLVALVSLSSYNKLDNANLQVVQSSSRAKLCGLLLLPPRSCNYD
jgi:nitric oxide synthase oxygenase domain/subunit